MGKEPTHADTATVVAYEIAVQCHLDPTIYGYAE